MTHGDVNTFAASLVEMALATKRVPELEAERDQLALDRDRAHDRIATLEVRAHQRNQEIEQLHARIRELEVQRDDAELRFLEADDAKATAVRTLRLLMGEAHSAIEAIEPTPVPPPPVVETVPVTEVKLVDSPLTDPSLVVESSPKASPAESPTVPSVEPKADVGRDVCDQQVAAYAAVGQSATDPTGAPSMTTQSVDVPSTNAESKATASSEEVPASPTPFAPSSLGDQSSAVGGAASASASSPSDPEPTDHLSDQWWSWHRRNHPEAYQPHSAA